MSATGETFTSRNYIPLIFTVNPPDSSLMHLWLGVGATEPASCAPRPREGWESGPGVLRYRGPGRIQTSVAHLDSHHIEMGFWAATTRSGLGRAGTEGTTAVLRGISGAETHARWCQHDLGVPRQ